MRTDLPGRAFHQLAPPEAGAAAVRREAGRRRRRRAVSLSAGAASLVVAAAVVVQLGGSPSHDSLQVTDPPTAAPSTAPTATGAPSSTPSAGSSAVSRPTSSEAPSAGSGGGPGPQPSATPEALPGYRTPTLVRTYRDRASPGAVSLCSGSTGNDDTGLHTGVDWCLAASVTQTSRGHDLVAEVCRDGSSDGRLTFGSEQEVELVVRRSDGTEVWRWSVGQPDQGSAHALDVGRDHCWDYRAPWTDVDGHGRQLASGSYELGVRSRATEMSASPEETAGFTV